MADEVSAAVEVRAVVVGEVAPAVAAADTAEAAVATGVRVRVADPAAGLVDARGASVNISARRKFAASAWIKWISSTTKRQRCCSNSCRSAASYCLGG